MKILAFVSCFEIIPPADNIVVVMSCIYLCWATADEIDYSMSLLSTLIILIAE